MNNNLAVYLLGIKAGILSPQHGEYIFTYLPEYVAQQLPAISLSLPLQLAPFAAHQTKPFFSNLLPDAMQRDLLAKNIGTSTGNPYAMLKEVGKDAAGAVMIVPETEHHTAIFIPPEYQELTHKELTQWCHSLSSDPLLFRHGMRLSLAGAQSKMAVRYKDGQFYKPLNAYSPSTHIIKPPPPVFPDMVYNEYFCMQLAALTKLTVANTHLVNVQDDTPILLIERYDRHFDQQGNITRIHQEDFCQALAVLPENKYQADGGPSLPDCFRLIKEQSNTPTKDIQVFLLWILFNLIIGNNDAHGKNISLLHRQEAVFLAPFYDLLSTAVYGDNLSHSFAMKINTKKQYDRYFTLNDLLALMQIFELKDNLMRSMIKRYLTLCQQQAEVLHQRFTAAYGLQKVVEELVVLINTRIKKLLKNGEKV